MAWVLIVDDEPGVLRVMTVTLRIAGFESDAFEKPAAALKAFARNPEGYDLLVTDVMMPVMGERNWQTAFFKSVPICRSSS